MSGTPTDMALAKIKILNAQIAWQASMYSELFDGVVTFSTDDFIAANDAYAESLLS
jgi:hypothetical protein